MWSLMRSEVIPENDRRIGLSRWHSFPVSTIDVSQEATLVARSSKWLRLAQLAKLLAWISLAWLCIEGSVAVGAGIVAGSIALVGFGLDSAIEGLASFIVIWRFSGRRSYSATSERRAQQLVALSFFLLAPYVAVEALIALVAEHQAATSWLGVGALHRFAPDLSRPRRNEAVRAATNRCGHKSQRSSRGPRRRRVAPSPPAILVPRMEPLWSPGVATGGKR
jgi:hypothetical protein